MNLGAYSGDPVLASAAAVPAVRYEHLDGLRGLAALNVALSHAVITFDFALYSGALVDSRASWDVPVSVLPFLAPLAGANTSVCIFFVLSGFVLTPAFLRSPEGFLGLALKRTIRLGLPIATFCIVSWAILASGLYFNHEAALITKSSWLDLNLAQSPKLSSALKEGLWGALVGPWSFPGSYDSSLWTMSIEYAGSLLLILTLRVANRSGWLDGHRFSFGLAFAAAGVLSHRLYLSLFAFGAALYLLDLRFRCRHIGANTVLMSILVCVALFLGTVPFSQARSSWWGPLIGLASFSQSPAIAGVNGLTPISEPAVFWHAAGAVLLVFCLEIWPRAQSVLNRPLPRFLGAISFPLYLAHLPVLFSVGCGTFVYLRGQGVTDTAATMLAVTAYAVIAAVVAIVANRYLERPSIRIAGFVARGTDRFMAGHARSLRKILAR